MSLTVLKIRTKTEQVLNEETYAMDAVTSRLATWEGRTVHIPSDFEPGEIREIEIQSHHQIKKYRCMVICNLGMARNDNDIGVEFYQAGFCAIKGTPEEGQELHWGSLKDIGVDVDREAMDLQLKQPDMEKKEALDAVVQKYGYKSFDHYSHTI